MVAGPLNVTLTVALTLDPDLVKIKLSGVKFRDQSVERRSAGKPFVGRSDIKVSIKINNQWLQLRVFIGVEKTGAIGIPVIVSASESNPAAVLFKDLSDRLFSTLMAIREWPRNIDVAEVTKIKIFWMKLGGRHFIQATTNGVGGKGSTWPAGVKQDPLVVGVACDMKSPSMG